MATNHDTTGLIRRSASASRGLLTPLMFVLVVFPSNPEGASFWETDLTPLADGDAKPKEPKEEAPSKEPSEDGKGEEKEGEEGGEGEEEEEKEEKPKKGKKDKKGKGKEDDEEGRQQEDHYEHPEQPEGADVNGVTRPDWPYWGWRSVLPLFLAVASLSMLGPGGVGSYRVVHRTCK
eukprot:1179579-Prorocentrum_minimum.AAC.1